MDGDALKKDIEKCTAVGEQKFYRYLLCQAINKLIKIRDGDYKGASPEMEFLDYAEKFLILYRRDDKDIYLTMSRIFRKAAHKIYRMMLKQGLTERNGKFLNLV